VSSQGSLFGEPDPPPTLGAERPVRLGHASIEYADTASILTRATGFMAAYDYTLNPYSGCSYGCTYCYAAFFARTPERRDSWGAWVQVKQNAVERLRRTRADLEGATVYMSSVTDPYQPIERRLGLVRALLPILAERGVRLLVQTRSSLVTRDIDLLARFDHVRVNMTVTTDSDRVRRVFEPWCPSTAHRLRAIAEVHRAGIPTSITMTPLLPVEDPEHFARSLLDTGVQHFVVQPFHPQRGKFVAGTRDEAVRLTREMGWTTARYEQVRDLLRARLPHLDEGQEGFAPP
jgi:DNA repair photolyase